jgi:hypothetical protein
MPIPRMFFECHSRSSHGTVTDVTNRHENKGLRNTCRECVCGGLCSIYPVPCPGSGAKWMEELSIHQLDLPPAPSVTSVTQRVPEPLKMASTFNTTPTPTSTDATTTATTTTVNGPVVEPTTTTSSSRRPHGKDKHGWTLLPAEILRFGCHASLDLRLPRN